MPIPGTTSLAHLHENLAAAAITLSPETVAAVDATVNERTVAGGRYNAASQAEIDTEVF